MNDLRLQDAPLEQAARLLIKAAAAPRASRTLPMLHADTYTGVGGRVAEFMGAVDMAREAVSDAAGAAAASVTGIMTAASEVEAKLCAVLGSGFTT